MVQQENQQNQQVVFLGEGSRRTKGREAQKINILIAKAVANAVRSTLGPKGMDKMIVDELGDITISNDGATVLSQMSIDHPAGKMMVEVAKTQESEVGDGTTTAVVLAGGLLQKAETMLDDEIHPSIIIRGYRLASKKAREIAKEIADDVSFEDKDVLNKIALTSMTGKLAESAQDLGSLVVDAVQAVAEKIDGKYVIDKENIKVEKRTGGSLEDSKLVKGIVLDKEIVHSQMPKKIKNARIALVDAALEIKSPETDTKVSISSPDQLQAFLENEEATLRKMVEKVKNSGANFLVCQKGIDDIAQHFLQKEGISAVRRAKKSDIDKLAKSTGAKIVSRINDLTAGDVGDAGLVEERKVGNENMVFVEGTKKSSAVTIICRGGSEHVIDEIERALDDAIGAVIAVIKDGKLVAGGGSAEAEIAYKLREYSKTVGGREQLAIDAFAETLEIIPRTLAETAGMDPLDTIVSLRSKHSEKNNKYIGVDVFKAKLSNMKELNVVEPLAVKIQAINSATEVSEMLLRIDDIIAGTSKSKGMPQMPPGMGGGMGDY